MTAVLARNRLNGRRVSALPWHDRLFGVPFADLPGEGGLKAAVPLVTPAMAEEVPETRNSNNRPRGPSHGVEPARGRAGAAGKETA